MLRLIQRDLLLVEEELMERGGEHMVDGARVGVPEELLGPRPGQGMEGRRATREGSEAAGESPTTPDVRFGLSAPAEPGTVGL